MTYRQKLRKMHPAWVSPLFVGGCMGCPGSIVNGASEFHGENCLKNCTACWDQEIPGTEDMERRRKVIYIAGKITGNPDYRREFNQAENDLLVKGFKPLNPAHLPGWLNNAQAMRICLSMIDEADAVLFLPNWQDSKGAVLEHDYCKYTGKTTYYNLEEVPNR